MNRRVALKALGLAASLMPRMSGAQPTGKNFTIGLLLPSRAREDRVIEGLRAFDYIEGRNITIERRYTEGSSVRLVDLAAELVRLAPDVIFVEGGYYAAAVRGATATIPIVVIGGDLVAEGLAASLARPGGNVTGVQVLQPELAGKRLALLKEAMPGLSSVGLLFGTVSQWFYDRASRETESAARMLGVQLQIVQAREPAALDAAFATLARERVEAVLIPSKTLVLTQQGRLAVLARRHKLPTMCDGRGYVEAGLLISYGPNLPDLWLRAAGYIDKLLKGARAADLPIEQPTKFELVINLKTAKALGLTIPPSLLLRADEVIQ